MKVRRVILNGVKNFSEFSRSFEDNWSGGVPEALLLIGPNGSGKSTLLSAVAELWQLLGRYLQYWEEDARTTESMDASQAIFGADLAAIEIVDLEREPVWVYCGELSACRSLEADKAASHRIGACFDAGFSSGELVEFRAHLGPVGPEVPDEHGVSGRPPADWARRWADRLTENLLGKRMDLPNVVYLASESRVLLPLSERFSVQPEPELYQWLARYEPVTSRKGSLQNYLYNLSVVDRDGFDALIEEVNGFLVGKRVRGFDRRTGDLMVAVQAGGEHPIEALSSGEKQVLLMLVTVTRWLRPGGIVLIDEPDLHLHVSLSAALTRYLQRLVSDKRGQLILASHEPELWRLFPEASLVRLAVLDDRGQTA